MFIRDFLREGFKLFRDNSVDNDRKAGQGYEVVSHEDTGDFELTNGGDEQGWLYIPQSSTNRNNMGAWVQTYPAILKSSDNKVYPIENKSLTTDSNFEGKSISNAAGNSATSVANATETASGELGIVVACPNQSSQEQIFFPIGATSTYYARIRWNFTVEQDLSEGELMTYNSSTNTYTATEDLIWIDWKRSAQAQFSTAGTDTIFEVEKLTTDVMRGNRTRDLYEAKRS